jgi:hypothetical protein
VKLIVILGSLGRTSATSTSAVKSVYHQHLPMPGWHPHQHVSRWQAFFKGAKGFGDTASLQELKVIS